MNTVAEAACEPLGGGDPTLDGTVVRNTLRIELLRQLVATVVEDGGSRKSYHRAMRLAEHTVEAVAESEKIGGLCPTPNFLVFLRRLTLGAAEFEFSGNSRLEIATPALRAEGQPTHQLMDLTEAGAGSAERAANALANRKADGLSILLVAGAASEKNAKSVRDALGRSYAFESVAEISSQVASGTIGGSPTVAFFVGERRPKTEVSLPEAARRTRYVVVLNDLDKLHTEMIRSRRRIAEWHRDMAGEVTADNEIAENTRQRPYVALSRVAPPVTMIPKSLEGATAKALNRAAQKFEDVDVGVAESIGMTVEELQIALSPEQVDAVALSSLAAMQDRGFLLADQTGIGKGRSLAAIARRRLINGGRVLYFTENAEINVPDVWRDFLAVGADAEANVCILASRPVKLVSPALGDRKIKIHKTEPSASRKEILASREWPAGKNVIITNYSQFSGKATSPIREWGNWAPDNETLLILDEAHNALNPRTNTGKSIRSIIKRVGNRNVIFATATPMRDVAGANLYESLLPSNSRVSVQSILSSVEKGGETAQECFTTMLAEDGVFLRRDHSLSNIEFLVRLPDDARIARYQSLMNRFAPLSELMLEAGLKVGDIVGLGFNDYFERLIEQGVDERTARDRTKRMFQHSAMASGPLANLARLTICAIKVDQVVEECINEIKEGRKPQITFHSTFGGLFSECVTNGGKETEIPLNFQSQISRVVEQIFRVVIKGERTDARDVDKNIADLNSQIQKMLGELPGDLPASPLDAVIEGLRKRGLSVGEISGRSLAYKDGKIVRRSDTDRRQTVQDYNDGKVDVLIFNRAGATGGSYHAAPEFRDQRPRSLIEMETPLDIIKYIQAQGRSNRFGQVARPRIVSVMTGLLPEMRILQQRNRKLRAMGASIDGNRSHPLLLDDVPDFLNKIGDLATMHVLKSQPDLARRLGFADLAEDDFDDDFARQTLSISDSGAASSTNNSLANRALTRSLVLPALRQTEFIDSIQIEFEAIVEELDSRNANPLKPKEMPGEVEIRSRIVFSGREESNANLNRSAFEAAVYISSGMHMVKEDPIDGEELLQMVNASLVTDGAEGFAKLAGFVESRIPVAISHLVRPGTQLQEAITQPNTQPYRFRSKLIRLTRFVEILRSIKPGRVMQIDGADGRKDGRLRTIVKLVCPRDQHSMLPQSYKVRTVTPGHSKPETVSVQQLMKHGPGQLRFLTGLELGRNERHLRTFNRQINAERSYPVQILNGNLLDAIVAAQTYRLGPMSIYRETTGQMQRGIVVTRHNVRLDYIPFAVPSIRIVKALFKLLRRGELPYSVAIEGFMHDSERVSAEDFRLYLHTPPGAQTGQFDFSFNDDFSRYFEEELGSDWMKSGRMRVTNRYAVTSREAVKLLGLLDQLTPHVEDGTLVLKTVGKCRKLLARINEDLEKEDVELANPTA